MIKAVIFDLDNAPIDFKKMKDYEVSAGYGDTTDKRNSELVGKLMLFIMLYILLMS